MRMLLILIALAIIVLVVKRLWFSPKVDTRTRRQLSGQMVQCHHCGMYLPEPEALRGGDHWFCSIKHRDAHRQDASGNSS